MVDHGINRPTLADADVRTACWARDAPDGVPCAARTDLELTASAAVRIEVLVAGSYLLWVDGTVAARGPLRYAPEHPEVSATTLELAAGQHAVAIQADAGGVTGRVTAGLPSFLWVRVLVDGEPYAVDWTVRALDEYADTGLRISPLLDRLEWLDRPLDPAWRTTLVDRLDPADGWAAPVPAPNAVARLGGLHPAVRELPAWPVLAGSEIEATGEGQYRESFTGYRWDDPAMQHALADRAPSAGDDADGRWWRFDLGRVRLTTVKAALTTTRPARVSIAHADRLDPHGEVTPVVALSTGPTGMLHHLAVGSGRVRAEPFGALGGRYVEVRVDDPDARLDGLTVTDRDALGEPVGRFTSGDVELDRIWRVGIDTARACAEDVMIDSVRERGGWVGDVVGAGIDLVAAGWGDQRITYRTLVHAAASARPDGLVAGCTPGEPIHLSTYAAQWLTGCVAAADADPDLPVLTELAEPARACVAALIAGVADDGTTTLPWGFVDWGHASPEAGPDPAVLLHLVNGLDAWREWQRRLAEPADDAVERARRRWAEIAAELIAGDRLTLHTAALGWRAGLVPSDRAADVIVAGYRRGFPFDPGAPRLRDPGRTDPSVVTPFFAGTAIPALMAAGRVDDAVAVWRGGWGWMLDQGSTTWWEVFDDRWSRCHFWSAAPTWQLTRYLLGARALTAGDEPELHLAVRPGPLASCSGRLPWGRRGSIDVGWRREGDGMVAEVESELPWRLARPTGSVSMGAGQHTVRLLQGTEDAWRPSAS